MLKAILLVALLTITTSAEVLGNTDKYLISLDAKRTKNFLYLSQNGEHFLHKTAILDKDSDAIFVCWKVDCRKSIPEAYYFPQSTITVGRNKLLELAMGLTNKYMYYVFIDGDVTLHKLKNQFNYPEVCMCV
jgi:hypothetical protein